MTQIPISERTKLKRRPDRGNYDRDMIYAILDEAVTASVAVSIDGQPHVQPMLHARVGDDLILHGSSKNRLLSHALNGGELCINVTLIDAMVLGASVPDHTMNYRSVTIYGVVEEISATAEKEKMMEAVFSSLAPDRWGSLPPVDRGYLEKVTRVLRLPLTEAVAKINESEPAEDPNEAGVWTGVLPVKLAWGSPKSMTVNGSDVPNVPPAIANYCRPPPKGTDQG